MLSGLRLTEMFTVQNKSYKIILCTILVQCIIHPILILGLLLLLHIGGIEIRIL